ESVSIVVMHAVGHGFVEGVDGWGVELIVRQFFTRLVDGDVQVYVLLAMVFKQAEVVWVGLDIYARPSFFIEQVSIGEYYRVICADVNEEAAVFFEVSLNSQVFALLRITGERVFVGY